MYYKKHPTHFSTQNLNCKIQFAEPHVEKGTKYAKKKKSLHTRIIIYIVKYKHKELEKAQYKN
jgi:hypothetical protein